ncbi:MAG: hypothetical protein ACLPGW_10395 [Roseiarcus sp.]
MRLKLFMDAKPTEIEEQVNEWLKNKEIVVMRTEVTMSNVAEKPDDGTYPCIVAAIWYDEKSN